MAAWRRAIELSFGDEGTAELNSIAQSRTEPASRVERARILLAYREDLGKDRRIFLRADRAVPYGELMDVLELLRNGGYLKITLVTLEGMPSIRVPRINATTSSIRCSSFTSLVRELQVLHPHCNLKEIAGDQCFIPVRCYRRHSRLR
jgi:hypothetical protein